MKFINKLKKYICNRKLIPYIIVLTILLLSVGYSAFSSNLSIKDLYAEVRLQKDIRVTGVSVAPETSGGTTTYIDYNVSNIQAVINLPNANSSVTFNVQLTNIGSAEVGIKEITGLPDNLDYKILNYNLKDKICNENNVCKLGIQKEIQVQIKYKDGYYDSSNTQYNVVANFNFQPFYTVTYTDIEGEGYPTEILGGDTLTVDFGDNAPNNIKVKMNNVETTNYTYENGVLTLPNVIGNIEIICPPPPTFAEADWSTIVANVQSGNLSAYKVGDTKEIALTGFTNGEEGSNGLYTIRIANTTSPTECSTSEFSQTACGFVIEFVDIITKHVMNSTYPNVGGWESSLMRTYVNSTIYESLPEELKTNIIDTYVVSGHGSTSGETNFKTKDKIYLLSTKEVWEQGSSNTINNDAARDLTRQLDYYKKLGVTTDSYSGAIKKLNGSANYWWLRSAGSDNTYGFYFVRSSGEWYGNSAHNTYGVAVAFRIG